VNYFENIYNGKTFRFTLNKSGDFSKFQIKIYDNNHLYFISRKIVISKHVIEEMIELFKTGNPYLNVSRFEFRDPDKSFLILIKGETIFIGKTYNFVSGKCEEFAVTDVDKLKFLSYLEGCQ
jgi:hypothetical protein